ncbi:MAG TPA: hypothetical protein VFN10_09050 [Thermoanaerobaculia bacterium]|nr:hypothetical protein [Thermoanaerobaculia bacterium]
MRHAAIRSFLAVSALGLALANNGIAGVNRWTIATPSVRVDALAADPYNAKTLYAAGPESVARSTDGGATWTNVTVPDLKFASAMRVAPSLPSTIYILGFTELFVSNTSGIAWTQRTVPSSSNFPLDLQVDAKNARSLVIAAANFCFLGCSGGGVFRSDDGGGSWHRIGFKDQNVSHVALDPSSTKTIYAATETALFKTTNGGDSWAIISPDAVTRVGSIAVDAVLPSTIYTGTNLGVFRSLDAGRTWELVRPSDYGGSVVTAPFASRNALATGGSLALTSDQGETWMELRSPNADFDFRGLSQMIVSDGICYLVANLGGTDGHVLAYEVRPPRRRAAHH